MGKAIITFFVTGIVILFFFGLAGALVGPFEVLLVLVLALIAAVAAYQLGFKRHGVSSDL